MDLSKLGEFGLIARFQSRLKHKSPRVIQGIGDDCAFVAIPTVSEWGLVALTLLLLITAKLYFTASIAQRPIGDLDPALEKASQARIAPSARMG